MRFKIRSNIFNLVVFFALTFFLTSTLHALDSHKRITQYDIRVFQSEDGLPTNSCYALFQDSKGYIWIGTQEGLVRYDGANFLLFTKDKYPGLREDFIEDIAEDKERNIWVATKGGGASRFDGKTFLTYDTTNGLASNSVSAITVGRDGTIWFGTEGGLSRLKTDSLTSFKIDAGKGTQNIFALLEDREGNLLVGGGQPGLYMFKDDSIYTLPLEGAYVTAICERNAGDVILGTSSGKLFSYQRGQIQKFELERLPTNHPVQDIHEDKEGNLWFCVVGDGIARYCQGDLEILKVENGLPGDNNFLLQLIEDREGSIWFVSEGGLFQMRDNKFIAFGMLEGFVNNNGASVCEDRDGNMWAALREGGIARFNDQTTKNYLVRDRLLSNEVESVYPAVDGGVWVGSVGGLNCFTNEKIIGYQLKDGLPENHIVALYKSHQGELWIGTQNGYLVKFNGNKFTSYRLATGESGSVIAIIETKDGDIWAGTRKQGMYEVSGGKVRRYTAQDGITARGVNAFYEDHDGVLWIATDDQGLYRYENGNFFNFSARDGLCFDRLYSILEDNLRYFWFHGNRGIFRVSKQELLDFAAGKADSLHSQAFSYLDGMRETECNGRRQPTAWKSRDGRLWFASIAGVVCVDPNNMPVNQVKPPVYVEKIITSGKVLSYPDSSAKIVLDHRENNLEFQYTALSFAVPKRVLFKYKLEGYDTDWVEAGTRRSAFYTNLSKGNYIFRVIACNNDEIWNEKGALVRFTITPFWWETGWAYLGYVVAGVMLLMFIVRVRTRKALANAQLRLKAEHAAKLEELDRIKTRFFANISHEFRTPLTLILGPLEQFLTKKVAGDPDTQYRIMYRNARRLQELINQLLDISKLEAGRMPLQTRPENVVSYMRTITMSFTSLAERKRISLEFNAPEEEIIVYVDHDKLEKIVNNLIYNAFKFTPEGGSIIVDCGFGIADFEKTKSGADTTFEEIRNPKSEISEFAEIRVRDTGPGIPPERLEKIFDRFYQLDDSQTRRQEGTGIGLALVKELVDLHKGEIHVTSEPGKGTAFIVRLPLGKDHLREDEIVSDAEKAAYQPAPSGIQDTGYPQSEERIWRSDQPSIVSDQEMPNSEGEEINISQSPDHPITPSPNILIVEDNSDLRYYIRTHLSREYRVIEAKNGKEGWEMALQTLPELVISDVMMPEMDGFELCRNLKTDEKTSHIPVILLTALASPESKLEGLDTRADDYIIKPFNAGELLARTRNLIELRKQLRERYRREITMQPGDIAFTRRDEAFLKKTFAIIEEHMGDQGFGVETLARELGWARETVYRKIKALTDLTAEKFIYDRRLRRAEQLLRESDYTITEIALETGFSSPGHLAKQFRERYAMSPKDYRKRHTQRLQ